MTMSLTGDHRMVYHTDGLHHSFAECGITASSIICDRHLDPLRGR